MLEIQAILEYSMDVTKKLGDNLPVPCTSSLHYFKSIHFTNLQEV